MYHFIHWLLITLTYPISGDKNWFHLKCAVYEPARQVGGCLVYGLVSYNRYLVL